MNPTDKRAGKTRHGTAKRPLPVAVALHHAPNAPAAPRVVASGRGFAAERILELAFANGIKVREDADLAEILAYIYRANQATDQETVNTEASP